MNPKNKQTAKRTRSIQLIFGGVVILLIGVLLIAGNNAPAQAEGVNRARVGEAIGDFELSDLDGNPVRLSDFQGKTILINAWATWCPPCRTEMPALHDFYNTHKENDFVILAVNAGESAALAAEFVDYLGLSFPVVVDPNSETLIDMGISAYPTSILVDGNGIVQYIHVGLFTESQLEKTITPLIGN